LSSELLRVESLRTDWGGRPVLHGVSFDVQEREIVTLLGPNGSGKTTLLRCIAGLEEPREGSIFLAGRPLAGVPTHLRGIGLVSQEPSLFPHRTVRENIAYGPLVQHRPDSDVRRRVAELLELL
jgi:thiamine transport system ATP-binding protein